MLASGAWQSSAEHWQRGLLSLLLSGPLLGTAWAACVQPRWRWDEGRSGVVPGQSWSLPYGLPGSPHESIAQRLADWQGRWALARERLAGPLIRLVGAGLFSLVVASLLGSVSLNVTAVGLGLAVCLALPQLDRWKRPLSILAPVCLAWTLGHSALGALSAVSVASGVLCGLILVALNAQDGGRERAAPDGQMYPGARALAPLAGHVLLAVILVALVQPIAGAVVVALGTMPLVMASQREPGQDLRSYFRSIQWEMLAVLLVAGLVVGYR